MDDRTPAPGYTAHLDQLGARARDLSAEDRSRIEEASARVHESPTPEAVGEQLAALRASGFE
ncbi:hypothetical protein ABT095_14515 [Kitasatospora sp. NPDC002227]|uniref:hypothetical protein n=1 Tax=Kitasatospora sp. NPDC002227 TaxID=3154773 RepID=UPI003326FAFD